MLFVFLNECIGGRTRVVSASVTFIFFGLGEVAINLVSIFMNYFRHYFVLQGVTIGLAGFLFLGFAESPFFAYKKLTLGHLYSIARFIISKNFPDQDSRAKATLEVQRLMGIEALLEAERPSIKLKNLGHHRFDAHNPERAYLALPDSSEKYSAREGRASTLIPGFTTDCTRMSLSPAKRAKGS